MSDTKESPRTGLDRLPILGGVLLVVLVAVAWPATRDPATAATSFFYTVAIVLNLAATVAAVVGKGGMQSAAVGYAIFGWAYLIATFALPSTGRSTPPFFSTFLIYWWSVALEQGSSPGGRFSTIVHSILAVISGIAGGVLARGLAGHPLTFARPLTQPTDRP